MTDAPHSTATVELSPAQRAYVDGLREVANLLEAHPEIELTTTPLFLYGVFGTDDESALERLTRLSRSIGGRWEKSHATGTFDLTRPVGPHRFMLYTSRENVCERVVTGMRTVSKPDPDADVPMIEVEEEIVEWVCPESILAGVES